MGTHLKMSLISKVLDIKEKSVLIKYIQNMKVTYKTDTNFLFVDLNCNNIPYNDKERLLNSVNTHGEHKITATGEQNVRFQVKKDNYLKIVLDNILHNTQMKDSFGTPKKVVMDFSSPNIAKPFHVGHLRSTIIGNFIGNINEYFSNNVVRLNYLGDWGTQFGLLQYGLKHLNITLSELNDRPMNALLNAYIVANKLALTDENVQNEARKYFSDIEQGKADLGDWKTIREITVKELQQSYLRLGIKFDEFNWESDYNSKAIEGIMKVLKEKNIITTDVTGMKVAKVKDRDVAILKSDNSTLYLSRDIAALLDRFKKYSFDEMLYIVDNSQTDHFIALKEIVGKYDKKCADACKHIKFGRVRGMSTRNGTIVLLNDILDEAKQKMYEQQLKSKNTRKTAINDATCDTLGITAVIINDLKQKRQKDYTFDWSRTLQSEGDSGIKLQYLHCRLCSLKKNSGVTLPETCEPQYLQEPLIDELITIILQFDEVLMQSKEEYEACILVAYLFRLARYVNRAFNELKVKNVNTNLAQQRLLVFHVSRVILKTGLEILGVKPLEEM